MDQKIIVCEKCKKDSDSIRMTMLAGDDKKLEPGTKVGQWKCARCGCVFSANEKMFLVVPFQKSEE